ncbi:MAG: hypothetical protein QOG53_3120 [Frankiales bacterium]|nr:hypothetical protein [Frankiales bacterium]
MSWSVRGRIRVVSSAAASAGRSTFDWDQTSLNGCPFHPWEYEVIRMPPEDLPFELPCHLARYRDVAPLVACRPGSGPFPIPCLDGCLPDLQLVVGEVAPSNSQCRSLTRIESAEEHRLQGESLIRVGGCQQLGDLLSLKDPGHASGHASLGRGSGFVSRFRELARLLLTSQLGMKVHGRLRDLVDVEVLKSGDMTAEDLIDSFLLAAGGMRPHQRLG